MAERLSELPAVPEAGPGSAAGLGRRWRRPSAVTVVIACCAAVGLLLRVYQLTRPGYLLGVTQYDDGTMFGNALRLVSGSIPYRDFQMVQPPGSMLILAPAALLAKVIGTAQGLAIARVLTVGADVANIVLIGVLVRRRGPLAAGIACGVYAVYPDALTAASTFMLEPWLNLCCLIATVLLFHDERLTARRARLAWAGVAFGFGAAVKIWAVVPFAIVVVLLVAGAFLAAPSLLPASGRDLRARLRPAAILTGGAALGLGVPLLPFAIMAPGGLLRGVLIGQFARNYGGRHDPLVRLTDMAGLRVLPGKLPNETLLWMFALVMLALYVGVYIIGPALRRQRDPAWLDAYALACAIATTVMFLWPRLYYHHYGAFAAPFLALAVALPIGRVVRVLPFAAVATAVLAVVVALGVVDATETQLRRESLSAGNQVAAAADRLIPAGACVLTNDASYTVAADRFLSADSDCPPMVDSFGTLFAMTSGGSIRSPRSALQPVRELWMSSLEHAQFFWITGDTTNQIPWDAALLGYFHAHYRLIGLGRKITLMSRAAPYPGIYRHV